MTDFENLEEGLASKLRTFLRYRGVPVGARRDKVPESLVTVLEEDVMPLWEREQLLTTKVAEDTCAFEHK